MSVNVHVQTSAQECPHGASDSDATVEFREYLSTKSKNYNIYIYFSPPNVNLFQSFKEFFLALPHQN